MSVENSFLRKLIETKEWETVLNKDITADYFQVQIKGLLSGYLILKLSMVNCLIRKLLKSISLKSILTLKVLKQ